MSAREIMAKAVLDAGMNMGALAHKQASTFEGKVAAFQIEALTAAGYRIIAPGELDQETLERAAEVAATAGRHPVGAGDGGTYVIGSATDAATAVRALAGKAGEA